MKALDLRGLPVIDDHVHTFGPEAGRRGFNPLDTVSLGGSDPAFLETSDHELRDGERKHLTRQLTSTLGYHHAVHALASILGCDANPAAVLAARDRECADFGGYIKRLYADINLERSLIDVGLGSISLDDFERLCGVPVGGIFRIENLLGALWDDHDDLAGFDRAFLDGLDREAASGRHVALKSIIAYRTGLAVEPPDRNQASRAFDSLKRSAVARGLMRMVHVPREHAREAKVLRDHWLWRALELSIDLGLPFQIHAGMGDQDLDINTARPGLLAAVFRDSRLRHARIVLLHGAYPFHEEASYLVDVFPNVYLDLSEHNLFLGPRVVDVLRSVTALAPFNKLLFGTDAYGSPDLQWVAARTTIDALAIVLNELVSAGSLGREDAMSAGERILAGNGRELYSL
ncbi:MAG TPA: amidohydrolase family protein [Candidatus Baltobacterales bacterium]|nr:amidohydrolase family protein [Candidatus Baltobacterales bacterium]